MLKNQWNVRVKKLFRIKNVCINKMIKGLFTGDALEKARSRKKASQFHVIINLNTSSNKLKKETRQYRFDMIKAIQAALKLFVDDIKIFMLDTDGDFPKITKSSFNLEIGKKKLFIHVDSYIYFDGFTLLDSKKMQRFFNEELKLYTNGTYVNLTYFHDTAAAIEKYSKKDGMPLDI